ncbi:MAG: sensor histidine kinase [Candidatus Latescibacterota bacterium]
MYRTGKPGKAIEQDQGQSPPVYWSYMVWPIAGAGESPSGIMMLVTDATETAIFRNQAAAMNEALVLSSIRQHKLTETAEKLNKRLHLLLNALPVGVLIAEDPECRFISANPTGARMFDLPEGENNSASAFVPPHHYFYQGRELAPEEMPLQTAVFGNREVHGMEIETRLPDGRHWTGLFNATPLHDREGNATGGIAIALDITGRKRVEAALEESNRKLGATLNALPDLLFEVDRAGRIFDSHVPDPEKLHFPTRDFRGRLTQDVFPPEAAAVISAAIDEAVERGRLAREIHPLEISGEQKWFEFSIASAGDHKNPDSRFIVLARDVTERRRLEENVQQLRREQEAFLRHEVKNLFAPMQLFAEMLLQDGENLSEQQVHYLQRIEESAGRVGEFIDALKRIYDIETGKYRLRRVEYPLNIIIFKAIHDLEPLAKRSGVTIRFNAPEKDAILQLDRQFMPGVFTNLILNAIEHLAKLSDPMEKVVMVNLTEEQGRYIVRINNKGTPISPERLATFFEKFNVGPEKRQGTGLGTTYASLVTKAHGGEIRVVSNTDEGTTVTVALPAK